MATVDIDLKETLVAPWDEWTRRGIKGRRLLEAGTYGPVLASAAAKATPAQQATLVTAPQNRAQMMIMNEQQAALYSKTYLDEWNRFQLE